MNLLKSAISDSSRFTLFYRTHYFRHFANTPDLVAESLLPKLGTWPEIFRTPIANFNSLNLGRRAWLTDRLIVDWLKSNPRGLVVNLGCGLDTLFQRLPEGPWEGVNLDHAEVIAAREQLGLERSNTRSIVATLTDMSWLSSLSRERPSLIVLNGVVPYLDPRHAHDLLFELSAYFMDAVLVFDVCSRVGRWITNVSICLHGLNKAYFQTSAVGLPKLDVVERYNLSDFSRYPNLDFTTRFLGHLATVIHLSALNVVKVGDCQ